MRLKVTLPNENLKGISGIKLEDTSDLAWATPRIGNHAVENENLKTPIRHEEAEQLMADSPKSLRGQFFNVPNQVTAARLILSIVVFVLIPLGHYIPAMVIFVIAAATDWVDGYWARRYGQVTKLGRVFDPFVDKIIICGAFIFLAAIPDSGIQAWMAVVVVGREMLVTTLRS